MSITKSDKSCCWSVTINNPTDDDRLNWSNLKGLPWVREVSGQIEQGEEGTLHIQGMVKTLSVRFAALKKALPRAHIEAARNATALAKYVVKEDTRVQSIPTVKTATQADVQNWVCNQVLEDCYRMEQKSLKEPLNVLDYVESDLILKYSDMIRKHWEMYVDEGVRSLIKSGYYGVEYVMANPQVRMAFKKYLPEICYRHCHAPQEVTPSSYPED